MTFQVDCGQAGSSVLFAAILGPEGRQGQVRLKHMGKNTYRVDYHVSILSLFVKHLGMVHLI